MECEVVVLGRQGGEPTYLLAEVSSLVNRKDVERALLQKASGVPAVDTAAGRRVKAGPLLTHFGRLNLDPPWT